MLTPLKRKRHCNSSAAAMDEEEEKNSKVVVEDFSSSSSYNLPYSNIPIPNPISIFWALTKLKSFQFTQFITNLLLSPIFFLQYLVSESVHHAEEAKDGVESSVTFHRRSLTNLVKKLGVGFLGGLCACMVVTIVMVVAVVVGIGLVHVWVEEPVFVREKLYFDYTDVNPHAAVFLFRRSGGGRGRVVPVGHTVYVSLYLLMPESDFNLQIGIFQLTAELISSNEYVIAKSSQPCMLRFRSLPIRLMRTFLMGIPLLLGITDETQKMTISMLKHKEGYPRTEAIRISMVPRANTTFVPQVYEAEFVINSQPPWTKEIVRRWKWTFCVWTSIHIYITLLIVLVCFFYKMLILPITTADNSSSTEHGDEQEVVMTMEVQKEPCRDWGRGKEDREVSEALRIWKQRRRERKEMLLRGVSPDTVGSSGSSTSNIIREETFAATTTITEDAGDPESVTFGGFAE